MDFYWPFVTHISTSASRHQASVAAGCGAPLSLRRVPRQDLVNLIITGKAVSNVFDGDNQLDEHTLLKGIKRPSRVCPCAVPWYSEGFIGYLGLYRTRVSATPLTHPETLTGADALH